MIVTHNEHVANFMNVTQNQTNSAIAAQAKTAASIAQQVNNKDAKGDGKQPSNSKSKWTSQ